MLRVWTQLVDGELLGAGRWSLQHRQFLTIQLVTSMLTLALFPVWILVEGSFSIVLASLVIWVIGPLAASVVLLKTRSLDLAFVIASISLVGLVCTVCLWTGGVRSFAIMWLLVVPFEAALSRKRYLVMFAMGLILFAMVFLVQIGQTGLWPQTTPLLMSDPLGFALGPLAVIAYSAMLTFRMESFQRKAEELILYNDHRYRLIAENVTDLITRHELDGTVTFASPSAGRLLNVQPSDLQGRGFFQRVHIADRPAYLQAFSNAVQQEKALSCEFRIRRSTDDLLAPDDEPEDAFEHSNTGELTGNGYTWVEMRCRPMWDDTDTLVGIVAVTRDIAERRDQQEALKKAHEDLQQLSDAKSRFLANMSHELRTPLNAIIGFSEILDQEHVGALSNDQQREYVRLIHASGSHLLQVVTDVLDMSKIESGTFEIVREPFDAAGMIKTCADMLSQDATSRAITMKTMIPARLPEVVADPRACRQILINLISNALKFSDDGGEVKVGARIDGEYMVFFVRDRGIGMSASDLKRIGQPFFQADSALDRRYEGTGLGVSVVKGLTELHDGRVEFESELGKGTTVSVFIPLEAKRIKSTITFIEEHKKVLPEGQAGLEQSKGRAFSGRNA
ncbi:MAG: PAS domain-containing sensor histidine kinase [Pseudomonadota bacterium]